MTIGAWSTYQIEQWLNAIQSSSVWLGLMDDDPLGVTDPLTVEISGGGYARPGPVSWNRPGPKLLQVHSLSQWSGVIPGSTVRAISGFDAATNGNMLFVGFPSEDITILSSGLFTLAEDEFFVGIDV